MTRSSSYAAESDVRVVDTDELQEVELAAAAADNVGTTQQARSNGVNTDFVHSLTKKSEPVKVLECLS